jgi:hypothetical protein
VIGRFYLDFLGRPQNMAAFQKWMAEEFEGEKK